MRRTTAVIALVLGVLLIAGAGVVRWVVAPAVTVLPGDTNTTRVYAGTASAVMNPTLLTGTLFGPALLRDKPVTVVHTDKVVSTKGDNALVTDRKLLTIPGYTVADVTYRYAVDRKNFGAGTGFNDVVRQTGITFNFPFNVKKQSYTAWVADIQKTTVLSYVGTATRAGVKTYVFRTHVPATRIADPQMLKLLPPSMPKSTIMALAPSLGASTAQLQQMSKVIASLPDPVPFGYTYQLDSTYYIAPQTGLIIDVVRHEVRSAAFDVNGLLVPVGPVLDVSYQATPGTLKAAANDAKDNASKLTLIHTTLPLVALGTGIVLLLVGGGLLVFRRRQPVPPAPPALESLPVDQLLTTK